jgi:hypothetical protein
MIAWEDKLKFRQLNHYFNIIIIGYHEIIRF